jgi:hypothetical protein
MSPSAPAASAFRSEAPAPRRPWQPPAVAETALAAVPQGRRADAMPAPPNAADPLTKLGFSFESSLPLAPRSDK